jgi:photosystem II stability/assembly factor-like uncharacterized protein
MQKIRFLLPLVFLLAVGLTGCGTKPAAVPTQEPTTEAVVADESPVNPTATNPTKGWTIVLQTEPVTQYSAFVAGFLDEHFGIIAGTHGEIHYTLDGGVTWPQAENESLCRFGLDVVDEQVAWTVGESGHVRLTMDGGKSWKAASDTPWKGSMVSFLDETTGWAANATNLASTIDGGQTWTKIAMPTGVSKIVSFSFRSTIDGYLLANNGSLYTTSDGGANWSEIPMGLEKKIMFSEWMSLASIRFADAQNGLIVLGLMNSGGTMLALRTADGGKTWSQEPVPVKIGAPFLTHDGTVLTVLGSDGRVNVLRYLS